MKRKKSVMDLLCLIPKRTKINKLLIINILIAIFLNIQSSNAQINIVISGNVFNAETKAPLSGASINVNGRVFAHTKSDGHFQFNAPDTSGNFQVTFVSYKTQTFRYNSKQRTFPSIILTTQLTSIDEVVISTGYQVLSKERATGSFDQIDNKLLGRSTSSNILDRLSGVASGLRFNGTAIGTISTNPSERQIGINIRGESTLSNNVGRDPLIVLDNFPYEGNISNLNPSDIESISILKDASAASIWGARSGNGVIVITSKQGRKNQPLSVDLNATISLQNKPNLYYDRNFLSSSDYIDVESNLYKMGYFDSYLNDNQNFPPVSPVIDLLDNAKQGLLNSTDAINQINAFRQNDIRKEYEKYMYKQAFNQQYLIGFRGGSNSNSYSFSVGYDKDQDNLVRNGFNRFTLTGTNVYNPIKNLEITTAISYTENNTALNNTVGYGGISVGGPILGIYPYAKFSDANGRPTSIVKDYRSSYTNSALTNGFLNWSYIPIDELALADNTTKLTELLLRGGVKYNFTSDLNIEFQYEREHQIVKTRNYQSPDTYAARNLYNQFTLVDPITHSVNNQAPVGGFLDLGSYDLLSQNGRAQINFRKTIKLDHAVTALAGAEMRQVESTGYDRSVIGYDDKYGTAPSELDFYDFYQTSPNSYSQLPSPDNAFRGNTNRFISYYANISYTFKNTYTIMFSGRKDGANIFGVNANDKITPLWSVGIRYNIDKSSFYNIDWLPVLKLRASYGYNGNVYNGSAYVTGTYNNSSLTGAQQILNLTAPNPELHWEKVRNVNFGLDFGTKGGRINGTIEYYKKDGQDLIESIPLATSTGFRAFTGNAASTTTRGFDISITTTNSKGAIKWNSTILLSTLKDKVNSYNITYSSTTILSNAGIGIPSVGHSIYGIYSYKWAGLDPVNGDPQGYLNGKISKDYIGIINNYKPDSLIYNGTARPTVYGSLRNDFSYKNFTFSANIGFEFGHVFRRSSTSINLADLISAPYSQNADFDQRWKKPGDESITSVPSLIYPSNNNRNQFYKYSRVLIGNASNVRLLDIRLAYDITKSQWRRLPFKTFQVFTYASNLGMIWRANKYGIDPDVPAFQSNLYPNPAIISFGFNAHF